MEVLVGVIAWGLLLRIVVEGCCYCGQFNYRRFCWGCWLRGTGGSLAHTIGLQDRELLLRVITGSINWGILSGVGVCCWSSLLEFVG